MKHASKGGAATVILSCSSPSCTFTMTTKTLIPSDTYMYILECHGRLWGWTDVAVSVRESPEITKNNNFQRHFPENG